MAGTSRGAESDERRGLPPKWSLALFALVGFSPAYDLYEAGTFSRAWLAFGVVSWAVATGPVAASESGQQVGAWFRAIGRLGRAAAILLFAAAAAWAQVRFDPPSIAADSFVLGGMVGLAVTVLRRSIR